MDDYINFIDALSQEANIMDKSFFIIVPFYPAGDLSDLTRPSQRLLWQDIRQTKQLIR